MHDKLSVLGADLLKETLPSIIEGTNESVPQDDAQATFASIFDAKMSELAGINQEDKCLIKFEDYHHGQLLIQLWMTLT